MKIYRNITNSTAISICSIAFILCIMTDPANTWNYNRNYSPETISSTDGRSNKGFPLADPNTQPSIDYLIRVAEPTYLAHPRAPRSLITDPYYYPQERQFMQQQYQQQLPPHQHQLPSLPPLQSKTNQHQQQQHHSNYPIQFNDAVPYNLFDPTSPSTTIKPPLVAYQPQAIGHISTPTLSSSLSTSFNANKSKRDLLDINAYDGHNIHHKSYSPMHDVAVQSKAIKPQKPCFSPFRTPDHIDIRYTKPTPPAIGPFPKIYEYDSNSNIK